MTAQTLIIKAICIISPSTNRYLSFTVTPVMPFLLNPWTLGKISMSLKYHLLFWLPQKDLRSLDVSLFYQLLALNEAIQDFKLNSSDRFSESGSEYSLGTASYMGSMTSLNDDSDWGEEGNLLNSSLLEGNDTLQAEKDNSTKELLMQISNLALKADQDF